MIVVGRFGDNPENKLRQSGLCGSRSDCWKELFGGRGNESDDHLCLNCLLFGLYQNFLIVVNQDNLNCKWKYH